MSASTERKNRQAAREAGTDKKTLAQEKELKEQAKSKRRWTLGTIAVVLVVAVVLLLNSSLVTKATAFTVGDKNFSTADVSYRYANQYYNFANQYGSYASLFGLDTSNGIRGLDKQPCSMTENGTWKDYFMDSAKQEMVQATIFGKYAADNGITLDEDDLATIDGAFEGLEEQARNYGYGSGDKMLAANYGDGVNQALIRKAYEESLLANKAAEALTDSFTYTEEELQEKYKSFNGEQDFFDYAYCYVSAETVETTGEDGETSSAPTEETLAAAKAKAEAIAETYKTAEGDDPAVRLNNAAAAEGQSSSKQTHVQGSGVPASEWMRDESRNGDTGIVYGESGSYAGYHVMYYVGEGEVYSLHLAEDALRADADGVYTDEAKEAAKAKAEEILAKYESGDKTEESFAALAEQYSEDTGSNTNGGLYENVAKGQMVQEFNDFRRHRHRLRRERQLRRLPRHVLRGRG